MTKNRKLWLSLAFLLPVAGLTAFLLLYQPEATVTAKTTRSRKGDLVVTITTDGKVEPARFVEVRAPLSGRITLLNVAEGSRVAMGQALMHLDSGELKVQLMTAESLQEAAQNQLHKLNKGPGQEESNRIQYAIRELEVELQRASQTHTRHQKLFAEEVITRQALEESQAALAKVKTNLENQRQLQRDIRKRYDRQDFAEARARIRQAQQEIKHLRHRIGQSTVTAPLGGTVYNLFDLKQDSYVTAGSPLAAVGDLQQMQAKIFVDQPDLGAIARGQKVRFTCDAFPNRTWNGQILGIPPHMIAKGSRTVAELECLITDPPAGLLPQMAIDAEIIVKEKKQVHLVPLEAVYTKDSRQVVYAIEAEHIVEKPVRIGLSNINATEILQGLAPGSELISDVEAKILVGARIKRPDPAP